jgi:hypothetical protein
LAAVVEKDVGLDWDPQPMFGEAQDILRHYTDENVQCVISHGIITNDAQGGPTPPSMGHRLREIHPGELESKFHAEIRIIGNARGMLPHEITAALCLANFIKGQVDEILKASAVRR